MARRRPTHPLALLALLALFPLPLTLACRDGSNGVPQAVGTLEMVETDVAPLVPARVVSVAKREGAAVRPGDTLATLTQSTLQADIDQRRARVSAAEAQLRDLVAGPRASEVQRAESELRALEADAARAARDRERLEPLATAGNISKQQYDAARALERSTAARRDAARQQLRLVREGTRPDRIAAARAEVATARAALEGARQTASDLVLVAPAAGVVTSRNVEPGEVVAAGTPAFTLGDPSHPFVRVYVDQTVLPRLAVGQRATATLDAFPDRPVDGRIVALNPKAEFTPRIALTEEERADLMFGVKVEFADTTGLLKAGLPVTVRFVEAKRP